MAVNTKAQGYSTQEVGQIIGKNYATVRRMVQKGTIKGTISKSDPNDKRVTVRIPRKALVEYLRENRLLFDDALLESFGITPEEKTQNEIDKLMSSPGESVTFKAGAKVVPGKRLGDFVSVPETSVEIKPGTDLNDISPCGTYLINDDDCCGVAPEIETKIPTYEILVNGRISVGNVQKGTAIDILRALASDPVFGFEEITIRKGR